MLVQELRWKKTHSSTKAFLPNPDDVTGDLNKLHIKELHNLYSCPAIISGVIKPKRINGRGMWHVLGRGEVHTGFWWANVRERTHLDDVGVDGMSDGYSRHRMGGHAHGSGEGKVAGSCDHGMKLRDP